MSSSSPPHTNSEVGENATGEDQEWGNDQTNPDDSAVSSASSPASTIGYFDEEESANTISTLIGSTANLCSATLGAGILALPFAFYQAGIICGLLLLLLSAWATSSSITLLAETFDSYRVSTYEKAVETGLGRRFRSAVEISILVFCCGTAVGYVIAVGDIIARAIPSLTTVHRKEAMALVWLAAMLPLSCLRRMKSLECASSVGIVSIVTLLVAAIVHLVRSGGVVDEDDNVYFYRVEEDIDNSVETFANSRKNHYDSDKWSTIKTLLGPAGGSWLSVLQACPIFFYAFSSQVNVAQIFEELPGRHGNNPQKIRTMNKVTMLGVTVCGLLYASLSLITLADFGDQVQPNVLSCFDLRQSNGSQPLLHIAFLGMALAVVIAFPLNIFPARVSLIQMWEERHSNLEDDQSSPPISDTVDIQEPLLSPPTVAVFPETRWEVQGDTIIVEDADFDTQEFLFAQHAFLTLLLAGLAFGLALIVPNISVVFGLLGGTTSSLLGFVVPGLLGLQLDRNRISAWFLVVFGSLIGIFTTGATIYSMVRKA